MTTQVSQDQRESLALQLLHFAPSRGANLFQTRRMVHEARWGGLDVQVLRQLRAQRPDPEFIIFSNAFGDFLVPVERNAEKYVCKRSNAPQNERLYRIFLRQMSS